MQKLNDIKLQSALDNLAKANTIAFKYREIIEYHCQSKYGYGPGDVDNDNFIDSCAGGCGSCSSMSSIEFHESMILLRHRAIELGLIKEDTK